MTPRIAFWAEANFLPSLTTGLLCTVLKILLLLLVGVTLALRCLLLVQRLRQRLPSRRRFDALASEFQRELRQRGLIAALPDDARRGSPHPRSPLPHQPGESAD